MKNLILSIVAILFFNINAANAAINVTASNTEKVLRIELDNQNSNVKIVLATKAGEIIHNQTVKKPLYQAEFDLSALPEGNYILKMTSELSDAIIFESYPLEINNNIVVLGDKREESVYLPQLSIKEDKLALNLLSLNRSTTIIVEFVNAKGETVHTDKFTAMGSKGRVYNIASLANGQYDVNLYFDGQKVQREFTK